MLKEVCEAPIISKGNTHVYAQYTIRLKERDKVITKLKEQGIPTAIYYSKCLHEQPVFASEKYQLGDFPFSELVSREVLSLPMHPFLKASDQDNIINIIREYVSD